MVIWFVAINYYIKGRLFIICHECSRKHEQVNKHNNRLFAPIGYISIAITDQYPNPIHLRPVKRQTQIIVMTFEGEVQTPWVWRDNATGLIWRASVADNSWCKTGAKHCWTGDSIVEHVIRMLKQLIWPKWRRKLSCCWLTNRNALALISNQLFVSWWNFGLMPVFVNDSMYGSDV